MTIRDAALEAALRDAPDDPACYAVYSDWLQSHGNPLGEIIALALAGAPIPPEQLAEMPSAELASVGWRWGMWDWLLVENVGDWMDDEHDAPALASTLFEMPACAALRELRIGRLRDGYEHEDVPTVLVEAARHAWARDLRELRIGDPDSSIGLSGYAIGVVGEPIANAFPKLRTLVLRSGDGWNSLPPFSFAGLHLPELASLTIETCIMTKARLDELYAAKLPALERLVLWFGAADYGATAALHHLAPIFDGRAVSRVTSLGLCNSEFANDSIDMLGHSRIAARLVHLDLSKGALDDHGAAALAKHARVFPALASLDITQTYVTAPAVEHLRAAFGPRVAITAEPRAFRNWPRVAVYQ